MATASVSDLRSFEDRAFSRFGTSASVSVLLLERRTSGDRFRLGIDLGWVSGWGPDPNRIYGMALTLMSTLDLTEGRIDPVLGLGVDAAQVRIDEGFGVVSEGFSAGVHASLGLHGFVPELASDRIYWRLESGFWGVGIGMVRSQLTLGYAL